MIFPPTKDAFNSGILATGVGKWQAVRFNYGPAAREWGDRVAAIENKCARHAVALRAAALQFPLAHPAVEIAMLGAQDMAQWRDALVMVRHAIPAAFWDTLRAEGLLAAAMPTPA